MRIHFRSGPTQDQIRAYGGLFATILFQVFFALTALAQSQTARYKVYETVDGTQYYHTESANIASQLIVMIAILIALELVLFVVLRRLFETPPTAVLSPMFILLTISVVYQCYITAPSASFKHFITILIGLVAFVAAIPLAKLGSRAYFPARVLRYGLYGVLILCALNIALGNVINGSRAFISIFGMSVQPGEVLKVLLIIISGLSFVQLKEDGRLRILFLITMMASFLTLIIIVRDVGNALILAAVCLMLFYLVYGLLPALAAAVVGSALLLAGYKLLTIIEPDSYIIKRVTDVGNALTSADSNSNLRQAVLSVVRGGFFGKGLEESLYATRTYAAQTDFCFDVIVSIFGASMGVLIVGCYISLLVANRTLRAFRYDAAQYSYANLMTALLCIQAVIHIGGNLNLIPLTGVCLPFISSGGTNVLASMMCMGFAVGCRLSEPLAARLEEKTTRFASETSRRLNPMIEWLRERLFQLRRQRKGVKTR